MDSKVNTMEEKLENLKGHVVKVMFTDGWIKGNLLKNIHKYSWYVACQGTCGLNGLKAFNSFQVKEVFNDKTIIIKKGY